MLLRWNTLLLAAPVFFFASPASAADSGPPTPTGAPFVTDCNGVVTNGRSTNSRKPTISLSFQDSGSTVTTSGLHYRHYPLAANQEGLRNPTTSFVRLNTLAFFDFNDLDVSSVTDHSYSNNDGLWNRKGDGTLNVDCKNGTYPAKVPSSLSDDANPTDGGLYGNYGSALQFKDCPPDQDYVYEGMTLPQSTGPLNAGNGVMTIEMWINQDDSSMIQPVVEFSTQVQGYFNPTGQVNGSTYTVILSSGLSIWLNRYGDSSTARPGAVFVDFATNETTPAHHQVFTNGSVLPAGGWHLLTVVYNEYTASDADGRQGVGKIYVDGVVVASASVGVFGLQNLGEMRIGYSTAATLATGAGWPALVGNNRHGHTFKGVLDQLRVLNVGLLPQEVAADYDGGSLTVARSGGLVTAAKVQAAEYPAKCNPTLNDAYYPLPSGCTQQLTISRTPGSGDDSGPQLDYGANNIAFNVQDRAGNLGSVVEALTVAISQPPPPAVIFPNLTLTNDQTTISYSWTPPSNICLNPAPTYDIYDCNGNTLYHGLAGPSNTETVPGPNQRVGRVINSIDRFQTVQSGSTTVYGLPSNCMQTYTYANPPGSFLANNFGVSSMTLNWTSNGNPTFTRWQLRQYSDNTFTSVISTRIPIEQNFTSTYTVLTGLKAGQAYYFGVRAFNGSGTDQGTPGNKYTTELDLSAFTLPSTTTLRGVAIDDHTIYWSWDSACPAAPAPCTGISYVLNVSTTYPDGSTHLLNIYTGANNYFTDSSSPFPYTPNMGITAQAYAQTGSGNALPSAFTTVYTLADPPTTLFATDLTSSSVVLNWDQGPGPNPGYTSYEIRRSSNVNIFGVISTVTTGGTSLTIQHLLPNSTYFFQIRASNVDGILSAPAPVDGPIITLGSSGISQSSSPYTTYTQISDAAAIWHFDESAGTAAYDATIYGNNAQLGCLGSACISTPTWTTGPSGLGSSLRFSGQSNGFLQVATTTALNQGAATGLTLEAWVEPTSVHQAPEATALVRGAYTDFDYTLDVVNANRWRFQVRDSGNNVWPLQTAALLDMNHWHQLTAVWTSAPWVQRLYVDGVFLSSAAFAGATGARAAAPAVGWPLTIGNRPVNDAGSSYNAPFQGLVDEVKIINRALSAAEIAAEYGGSHAQTVHAPWPNDQLLFTIPANAFGGAGNVMVSNDPRNSPLQASAANVSAALAAPQTFEDFDGNIVALGTMTLINGSLFEAIALVNGAPFVGYFGSTVTISIPYSDADNNGLVDGTTPPIEARNLRLYTIEEGVPRWRQLTATVDTANHRVLGLTPHFSVFALFGASSIQPTLGKVTVYPVPWKPGSMGRFDSATFNGKTGLAFSSLPSDGVIKIFTLSGEQVIELQFSTFNDGTVIWDGKDAGGHPVASGVYLALVRNSAGNKIVKFAIER
ncbi:MAG: fibronectin type III domain-containing protein [Elusimicrobia bacterium]|nr:fibronectin type III domain-containing protein [Elusimicrobiota bacterium]